MGPGWDREGVLEEIVEAVAEAIFQRLRREEEIRLERQGIR